MEVSGISEMMQDKRQWGSDVWVRSKGGKRVSHVDTGEKSVKVQVWGCARCSNQASVTEAEWTTGREEMKAGRGEDHTKPWRKEHWL